MVEIDCGAGRCGVTTSSAVVEIAKAVARAENLEFKGIQAYQGAMQHMDNYEDRKAKLAAAIAQVTEAVDALKAEGLNPELVSGGVPVPIILKVNLEFTMSFSAVATLSWTRIMDGFVTSKVSVSTKVSGKMRCSF
ncbi:alanine racemase [Pseudomonas sp. NA13]